MWTVRGVGIKPPRWKSVRMWMGREVGSNHRVGGNAKMWKVWKVGIKPLCENVDGVKSGDQITALGERDSAAVQIINHVSPFWSNLSVLHQTAVLSSLKIWERNSHY